MVHHRAVAMSVDDERLVVAYFAECDRHLERWRRTGGRWSEFDGGVPIEAMQAAALTHPNPKIRRDALGVLDHAANDVATSTFRAALADPVPRVRRFALHGLACERCRIGEVRVDEIVTDVLRVLRDDPNPRVRHAAIDVLVRFMDRDERIVETLGEVADDDDECIRVAATGAAAGEHRIWSRKAVRRRSTTSHGPGDRRLVG